MNLAPAAESIAVYLGLAGGRLDSVCDGVGLYPRSHCSFLVVVSTRLAATHHIASRSLNLGASKGKGRRALDIRRSNGSLSLGDSGGHGGRLGDTAWQGLRVKIPFNFLKVTAA